MDAALFLRMALHCWPNLGPGPLPPRLLIPGPLTGGNSIGVCYGLFCENTWSGPLIVDLLLVPGIFFP
jgi:hypothetical protein